jgi:hypothetical protein
MAKRRAKSQIGNLTPNHKKSGITPISSRAGGMQDIVGKLSTKATTLLQTSSQSKFVRKIMGPQSCESPSYENFRTPTWESWDKMPFACGLRGEAHSIL